MKIIDNDLKNCCFICNRKFIRPYKIIEYVDYNIMEIDIITSHTRCRKLMQKREKLKRQLVDVDFELFCLMN